jgi:hypothetical protein
MANKLIQDVSLLINRRETAEQYGHQSKKINIPLIIIKHLAQNDSTLNYIINRVDYFH